MNLTSLSRARKNQSLLPKERELLAATVGIARYRVLTRWPLTVAFGPQAWLPGVLGAVVAMVIAFKHGVLFALTAAVVAGAALTLSVAAHEVGHLLTSRHARGVSPRMLLMRSSGGASIVEGRFEEARGAAIFAAGGPLATFFVTIAVVDVARLLPFGAVAIGLYATALVNLPMLLVNLLPIAPMDGYALLRSAIWAGTGSRAEAERRAIEWSRVVLVSGLSVAVLILSVDRLSAVLAVVLLTTLTAQHHVAARPAAEKPAENARARAPETALLWADTG